MLSFILAGLLSATNPEPTRALLIEAGVGVGFYTGPNNNKNDASSIGFIGQVEHIWLVRKWFTPRVYAGMIFTGRSSESCGSTNPCDVTQKLGFLGGKMRLMAPIPWVGPFLEAGLGMSVGSIHAQLGDVVNKRYTGAFLDVPLSFGLAIGPRHQFELAFNYLLHPTADAVSGGFMLGIGFPL